MSIIPEELLEQLERGNVLLLIGEGINQGVLPSSQELTTELATRCDYPPEEPQSFARVASYYELTRDRHGLVMFLRDRLLNVTHLHSKSALHQLVTGLGVRIIVTTCVDQLLVQALNEAKIEHTQVVGNSDVAYSDEQRLLLIYLWGVLDQPNSLIITEEDQRRFLDGRANLSDVLRGELARRTWLLIGFDASDEWFRSFYEQVTHTLDHHSRRAYILGSNLGVFARAWWGKKNAELLDVEVELFLQQLIEELAARRDPAPAIPFLLEEHDSRQTLSERPYKFLDYYEAKDAAIFYGRQQETGQLCARIHAHRLVLLYGASGVGKTSLLLAGTVPRLSRATPPYKAIYIRALEDPALVIRRTLRRMLPDASLPNNDVSLVDFLALATNALGQTLVIILDQFEEFFIRLSPRFRAAFIAELGALYDTSDVPVKMVFSLREDWLASMGEIEARIPTLFNNRMRLLRLKREQAHQAITAPVKRLGISYESALLERLLDDLLGSDQEVMPPQLQLICSALYDERKEHDRVLKVTTYDHLGGVQGVLRRYLEEELTRLEPAQQAPARAILEELITSEKTKAVKSSSELALRLETEQSVLEIVLKRLVQARLLRVLQDETGHRTYELAHEYLIQEISLTTDTQVRKQAEELIKQEVSNWQRFGTVLGADKLALINNVRDVLRLNDEVQALLLHSALQVGQDIEYWLNRISDPVQRISLLSEASQSKLPVMRERAVQILGTQDVSQAVEPLLTVALHDSNSTVRNTARQSLAQLTQQHSAIVTQLMSQVENTTDSTRAAALRTLTYLPLSDLPLILRAQVLMMRIRLYLQDLIKWSLSTPSRRAIAITTGLFVLLVTLAYLISLNAYYVDSRPSAIPGEDVIVIRQGHPLLKLPGLSQVVVNTRISTSHIANDRWEAVHREQLWGVSSQTAREGFYKWGQDVADTLNLEHRLRMLWYLGQEEQAFQAILEGTRSQETKLQLTLGRLLKQIVEVHPQLVEQAIEILLLLLESDESQVRNSANSVLQQTIELNPQQAESFIARLLLLLEHKNSNVRVGAAEAVGQVVVYAHPEIAQQAFDSLLILLEENDLEYEEYNKVAFAIGQAVETNPKLAPEAIGPLLELVKKNDATIRPGVVEAVGKVVQVDPDLAAETIQSLLELLENGDEGFKIFATVGQVLETNPELDPQVIESLWMYLEKNDHWIRAKAVAKIVQDRPDLTEEVFDVLLVHLQKGHIWRDEEVTKLVGVVLEVNPELALQILESLLERLQQESSPIPKGLGEALGLVLKADSELADQALEPLLERLQQHPYPFLIEGLVEALGLVLEADPQLADQALDPLLERLQQHPFPTRGLAEALGLVLEADSELADKAFESLLEPLQQGSFPMEGTVETLGLVLEADPQLGEQLLEVLLPMQKYFNSPPFHGALFTIAQVVVANPELAPKAFLVLLPLLKNSEVEVRRVATSAVGQVVKAHPKLAEELIDPLLPLLEDSELSVRTNAWSAVGQAYAHTKSEDLLFEKLKDPHNALERPVAARALFLITLQQPSRGASIRQELQDLSNSQEPMERIWANKTLAMLELATEAHEAAEFDGTQRQEVTNKLQTLCDWIDHSRRCKPIYLPDEEGEEDPNFFGEEFTWAAGQALDWLEEQANEQQAE